MHVMIKIKSGTTKERLNEFLAELRKIKPNGFDDVIYSISMDTMNIIDLDFEDGEIIWD